MAKRSYRSISVNSVNVTRLLEQLAGGPVAVGVDVAKEKFFAAFMAADGTVACTVTWRHPTETPLFVALVGQVRGSRVAMESTGRYGDILADQLRRANIPVYGVSSKRVSDLAEAYDGVPSKHDAKDAAVIADALLRNKARVLRELTPAERRLNALTRMFLLFKEQYERNVNRIEAELARFWPEATEHVALQSITLATLLEAYGTPAAIGAASQQEVEALVHKVSRGSLGHATIEALLSSARTTAGVRALPEERFMLQRLAQDTLRARRDMQAVEKQLEAVANEIPSVQQQASLLGTTTAAVIAAKSGDVGSFACPRGWLKQLGLNLTEHSSGKQRERKRTPGVHIAKRGCGMSRRYLFLASLRLLQRDRIVKAWYAHQTQRPGAVKMRVVVALMRKLAKAMWHVARGADFDARKLFDTRPLNLSDSVIEDDTVGLVFPEKWPEQEHAATPL